VALPEDLQRIAAVAAGFADHGEEVVGIVPCEPGDDRRVYLCAYVRGSERAWLALDDAGVPIESRARVRDAVSIAAMCEVAEDTAGGGDLEELRSQLVSLRLRENPPGIDDAEDAALALERTIGAVPRVASANYLDEVGAATRKLEHALGQDGPSAFAAAMQTSVAAVEALYADVEAGYKAPLV